MCELINKLQEICIKAKFSKMEIDFYTPKQGGGVENIVWTRKGSVDQPTIYIRVHYYQDEITMSFVITGIGCQDQEVRFQRPFDKEALSTVEKMLNLFQIDLI